MLLIDQLVVHVKSDIVDLQLDLDTCNDRWIEAMEQADRREIDQEEYLHLEVGFRERVGRYVESLGTKEELLFFLKSMKEDFIKEGDLQFE